MEDIDRESPSYLLKKSLLQRAWRSANPEKASELIAVMNNASKWRRTPAEEDAQLETRFRDAQLAARISRHVDSEDIPAVLRDIEESRHALLETNAERFSKDRSSEDETLFYENDSLELRFYIETEMHDEMEFRSHLLNAQVCTEETLPALSFAMIRLNAFARMKADRIAAENNWPARPPARLISEESKPYAALREEYFRSKKRQSPGPSIH